jgi:hypothetical protein
MRDAWVTGCAEGENVGKMNFMSGANQFSDEEMTRQVAICIKEDGACRSDPPKDGGKEDVLNSGEDEADDFHPVILNEKRHLSMSLLELLFAEVIAQFTADGWMAQSA